MTPLQVIERAMATELVDHDGKSVVVVPAPGLSAGDIVALEDSLTAPRPSCDDTAKLASSRTHARCGAASGLA